MFHCEEPPSFLPQLITSVPVNDKFDCTKNIEIASIEALVCNSS